MNELEINNSKTQVDFSNFPVGIYIVKLLSSGRELGEIKKVVKNK